MITEPNENENKSNFLIDSQLKQLQLDKQEVTDLILSSKSSHVRTLLNDYLNNLDLCIKSTEKNLGRLEEISKETQEEHKFITVSKYSWVDNKKTVKVYLTDNFENIDQHSLEKVQSTFEASAFEIRIFDWKGKNWRFSLKNLSKDYNYKDSNIKLTKSGINVTLKKDKEEMWFALLNK